MVTTNPLSCSNEEDRVMSAEKFPSVDNNTMLQYILANPASRFLLTVTGNYFPSGSWRQKEKSIVIYNIFILGLMVYLMCASVIILFQTANHKYGGGPRITKGAFAFTGTVLLSCITMLICSKVNHKRLAQKSSLYVPLVVEQCAKLSTKMGSFLLCLNVMYVLPIFLTHLPGNSPGELVWCFLGQFVLTAYLSFNLMILLIDVKINGLLIDELLVSARNKSIQYENFESIRQDIHCRVEVGRISTTLIIVPCIVEIILMIIISFGLFEDTMSILWFLVWFTVLFKDILFLLFAFYFVAEVNSKADALSGVLSVAPWCKGRGSREIELSPDVERISILLSSLNNPISVLLVGLRISWSSVNAICVSLTVSVVSAVIKYSVEKLT